MTDMRSLFAVWTYSTTETQRPNQTGRRDSDVTDLYSAIVLQATAGVTGGMGW